MTKREIENEARRSRAFERERASEKKKTRENEKKPSRAFVVVSHVVDPPAGATLAPYEASHAALAAVIRALAADLRNVASELDETRRANKHSNKNKHSNTSEDVSFPYPYGGGGGVVAALLDPGRIPGLALERDGADVGPLHKTHGDALAADWARAAVPFVLQMTHEAAGETVRVPGFR